MRGAAPSELAAIGCEFCAYQFDEALMLRENAAAYVESVKAERRQAPAEHGARAAEFAEEIRRGTVG